MALAKMYSPYIPSSIISKYIAQWMSQGDRSLVEVEWATGLDSRSIYRIINGKQETVRFDTADRILIGLGFYMAWHQDEELAQFYAAA